MTGGGLVSATAVAKPAAATDIDPSSKACSPEAASAAFRCALAAAASRRASRASDRGSERPLILGALAAGPSGSSAAACDWWAARTDRSRLRWSLVSALP